MAFVIVRINDMKDARTGKILNQIWEVSIDESIGRNLLLFLILNWSQKIDKG